MGTETIILGGLAALGVMGQLFGSQMGGEAASSYNFPTPTLPAEIAQPEVSEEDINAQAKAERDALDKAAKQNVLTSDAGILDEAPVGGITLGDDIFGKKYGLF